jgi:3-phenylpropionate/trans-cinnamate dioxygenase ferredoxin reductase subunit
LQFQGFPARPYSPTFPLEGAPHDLLLHFHIRKVAGGQVSSALGEEIRAGHRVKLTGPHGRAFFRQGHSGRIVLVASGTGFAPMWSVAVAAIMEQPQREMVFIVQARSIRSLYMHAALCRLALFPNVTLIPMVSEPQQISHAIQSGRPTDHLPKLSPDDVVYTAGAPAMTDAVARIAKAAGARCYTDPFVQEPRTSEQAGLMSRLTGWLNDPKSGTAPPQPARKPAPMTRGVAAVGVGNR